VFLIGLSFLDCTQTALAVTLLTMSLTISSTSQAGFFVNNIDIAPLYAGTLMGVSNGIAAASGFMAPVVTAVLTTDVRVKTISFLILEYNSIIWSPSLIRDIELVEKVQRYFTKRLLGMRCLSYDERLQKIGLPRLELRRLHLL